MTGNRPPTPSGRRAAAGEKLTARRLRVRTIRRRVAGLSLATFLAASGAVLVQLVTGHDPALAHHHQTTGVTVTRSSGSSAASSSGSAAATSPSMVLTSAS